MIINERDRELMIARLRRIADDKREHGEICEDEFIAEAIRVTLEELRELRAAFRKLGDQ